MKLLTRRSLSDSRMATEWKLSLLAEGWWDSFLTLFCKKCSTLSIACFMGSSSCVNMSCAESSSSAQIRVLRA